MSVTFSAETRHENNGVAIRNTLAVTAEYSVKRQHSRCDHTAVVVTAPTADGCTADLAHTVVSRQNCTPVPLNRCSRRFTTLQPTHRTVKERKIERERERKKATCQLGGGFGGRVAVILPPSLVDLTHNSVSEVVSTERVLTLDDYLP